MWNYKNKKLNDVPEGAVGFIYEIKGKPNTPFDGYFYIGKKSFYSTKKKKLGKKEVALITDKRLKKYTYETKESDWKTYKTSSKEVKSLLTKHPSYFDKIILEIVTKASALTYKELKYQINRNCLEDEKCWNENLLGKIFKSHT